MLVVETIAKIRRYYFVEGRKIKEISRDLRISRNTIRKVIRSGATEHRYEREEQPSPKLGDFQTGLKGYSKKILDDLKAVGLLPRDYMNCFGWKVTREHTTAFSAM